MSYRPASLEVRWNADLSISIRAASGGKVLFRTRGLFVSPREQADTFIKGWFGDARPRVRWVFSPSKSAA